MATGNQLPNLDQIFREEDDTDFIPSSGSNLAAIFNGQNKVLDTPTTAKHVHKKSSIGHNASQNTTTKSDVIIAKVVYAYKLQNETYMPVGKLGMAITSNELAHQRIYRIILYKNKQEYISVAVITSNFVYTVLENNYSSYYDSNNENWSIRFDNQEVCTELAREVGLARFFSRGKTTDTVFYQDLSHNNNEGIVAKEGDNICIRYLIHTEIVQPFKGNCTLLQTMTIEISTDNSWERSLLGTTKGLRRILFLPSNKQISLGPGFPKEREVMLEVEIVDIKRPEVETEHKTTPSDKAAIISRMAKVGQSMLPHAKPAAVTDFEDTEDEEQQKLTPPKKVDSLGPVTQRKPLTQEHPDEVIRNLQKTVQDCTETCSTAYSSNDKSAPIQTVTPPMPAMMDPSLNLILSETRMSNTELRMGMYKIADNVQKLLDKFHAFELRKASSPTNDNVGIDTTLKMLLAMNTYQTEKMQCDPQKPITDTSKTVNEETSEIQELKSEVSDLKLQLKESVDCLTRKLDYIKSTEAEKQVLVIQNQNLERNVKELEHSLKRSDEAISQMKEELEEIRRLNYEYEKKIVNAENRICEFEMAQDTLEKSAHTSSAENKENKHKEIKYIINKAYRALLENFEDESYSRDYIRATIASVMKNITLVALNENQDQDEKVLRETRTLENVQCKNDDTLEEPPAENVQTNNFVPEANNSVKSYTNNILRIRDEPPPIPPNDTETDSDSSIVYVPSCT